MERPQGIEWEKGELVELDVIPNNYRFSHWTVHKRMHVRKKSAMPPGVIREALEPDGPDLKCGDIALLLEDVPYYGNEYIRVVCQGRAGWIYRNIMRNMEW